MVIRTWSVNAALLMEWWTVWSVLFFSACASWHTPSTVNTTKWSTASVTARWGMKLKNLVCFHVSFWTPSLSSIFLYLFSFFLFVTNTSAYFFLLAVWHHSFGPGPLCDQLQQRHAHPLLHLPFTFRLPLRFSGPEVKNIFCIFYLKLAPFPIFNFPIWCSLGDISFTQDSREWLASFQSLLLRLWKLPNGSHFGDVLPRTGWKEWVP